MTFSGAGAGWWCERIRCSHFNCCVTYEGRRRALPNMLAVPSAQRVRAVSESLSSWLVATVVSIVVVMGVVWLASLGRCLALVSQALWTFSNCLTLIESSVGA